MVHLRERHMNIDDFVNNDKVVFVKVDFYVVNTW